MKKEDLMIGDWVIRRGVPEEPMRLYDMKTSAGLVYLDQDGRGVTEKFENIEPILLTHEIMEKNGFNLYPEETNVFYLNAEYRHDLDTVCLYIGDIERPSIYGNDSLGEKTYVVLHCKYVHELQHLLKLCGIEKEIIL